MKRDEDLIYKLLLRAEGDEPRPDLSAYSEEQRAYHTAMLIDAGLVRGLISRDEVGRVRATATTELTPQGHDYLAARRAGSTIGLTAPQSQHVASADEGREVNETSSSSIAVFISHSSLDASLAKEFAELFILALGIRTVEIRCTSVDGFRLEAGALVTDQLQREVFESKAVVALLTPASLESAYVLFELGARWGARKKIFPILAAGASASHLEGPLMAINALRCDRAGIAQLITDLGRFLGQPWDNPAASQSKIESILNAQPPRSPIPLPPEDEHSGYDRQDVISILEAWLGENLDALENRVIDFDELDSKLSLPSGSSKSHLDYAARRKGLRVIRKGTKTILFEPPSGGPVWV